MAYLITDDKDQLVEAGGTLSLQVDNDPLRLLAEWQVSNGQACVWIRGTQDRITGEPARKLVQPLVLKLRDQR